MTDVLSLRGVILVGVFFHWLGVEGVVEIHGGAG